MRLRLSTYAYFDPRRRSEGLRIGCARYLVRGVKEMNYAKQDVFDVWLPTLAPSRQLLDWFHRTRMRESEKWQTYVRRYKNEMKKTNARQTIRVLAMLAQKTPVSLGCYCRGKHCHRFVLERLIRSAAAGRF
jgi:uncharacterized protein YeaO (DUF488 family)